MKTVYSIVGVSKQALHQHDKRQLRLDVEHQDVLRQASVIRQRHPGMGCRTIYDLLLNVSMGRDKVERFLLGSGFRLKRKVNFLKTTQRQRSHNFPNLINGLALKGINRVWQTDITYFILAEGKVFYLVFIIDVYSRRIIGHTANDHMKAEANLECLQMAFEARAGHSLKNLIHHSDHGGQYIEKNYLNALRKRKIRISMGNYAWENAYTERINGTLKNDYLTYRDIDSLSNLRKMLAKDVHAYNFERPHRELPSRMSPMAFEEYLTTIPKCKVPTLKLFNHGK
jgi:transposase InsO family protein